VDGGLGRAMPADAGPRNGGSTVVVAREGQAPHESHLRLPAGSAAPRALAQADRIGGRRWGSLLALGAAFGVVGGLLLALCSWKSEGVRSCSSGKGGCAVAPAWEPADVEQSSDGSASSSSSSEEEERQRPRIAGASWSQQPKQHRAREGAAAVSPEVTLPRAPLRPGAVGSAMLPPTTPPVRRWAASDRGAASPGQHQRLEPQRQSSPTATIVSLIEPADGSRFAARSVETVVVEDEAGGGNREGSRFAARSVETVAAEDEAAPATERACAPHTTSQATPAFDWKIERHSVGTELSRGVSVLSASTVGEGTVDGRG